MYFITTSFVCTSTDNYRCKHAVRSLSAMVYRQVYTCMVPQIFNLRPHLLKSIVHAIRFITNRKYGFYCIY